jgi:hypothetical protein
MTLTNESLELLKTDTDGRVRTTPERREALLDEFERSGLSGMRFAARYGIKYPTFANWAARRRRERMGGAAEEVGSDDAAASARQRVRTPAQPVRWLEAVAESPVSHGHAGSGSARGVILYLPGGARMEVAHADQAPLAAALMRALSGGAHPAHGGNDGAAALRLQSSSLSPAPSC